jgi:GNAT superfamily N-acetyltransferase
MSPDDRLQETWRWLYRVSEPNGPHGGFPLIMVADDRIVAHAGGIPFTSRFAGREYRAAWYVDFAVLPEFQRRGLGVQLTQAWMAQSDLYVTFCNELSMGVFRRFGWVESFDTSFHSIWLKPFEHPRLARALPGPIGAVANQLFRPVAGLFHRCFSRGEPQLLPVDSAAIAALTERGPSPPDEREVTPVRDTAYFAWRLASSPDLSTYRVYRDEGVSMIVKLSQREPPSVDVLWISDTSESAFVQIRRMLASLARWALGQGFSSVRHYPTSVALSRYLRPLGPVVSRPRFAYWTKDAALIERLRHATWRWQLIDSDFEWV